jgi:uncharacterized membrane protein
LTKEEKFPKRKVLLFWFENKRKKNICETKSEKTKKSEKEKEKKKVFVCQSFRNLVQRT